MSTDEKFYYCPDQGIASFIWFVTAGEDTFDHIDFDEKGRPVVVFRDNIKGTSCTELVNLYHSGAQLTDVKEFCRCYQLVGFKIRSAYRGREK